MMIKRKLIISLFVLLIVVSISHAGMKLPEHDSSSPVAWDKCTWACTLGLRACKNACSGSVEITNEMLIPEIAEIQAQVQQCQFSCVIPYESCNDACHGYYKKYYDTPLAERPPVEDWGDEENPFYPDEDSTSDDIDNNRDNEKNTCPNGYKMSNFNTCCREGYTARKGTNDIIFCDMNVEERSIEVISVQVDSKYDHEENKVNFKMTFSWKEEDGSVVDPGNHAYPGKIIVNSGNSKLNFDVSVANPVTDSSGTIYGLITVSKFDIGEKDPFKYAVEVYNSEDSSVKGTFSFKVPPIRINYMNRATDSELWQNKWTSFELNVFDPYNMEKTYSVWASDGDMKYGLAGIDNPLTFKSSKNSINFGWLPPKITKEVRLNYGTKIVTTAIDLAIKKATDGGKNKLKGKLKTKQGKLKFQDRYNVGTKTNGKWTDFNQKDVMASLEHLEKLEKRLKNVENAEAIQGHINNIKDFLKMGPEEKAKLERQGADKTYYYGKVLIKSMTTIEGVLGQAGIQSFPITALLSATQAVFDVTDELYKLGEEKKISKTYTISAYVKSNRGNDAVSRPATVEGYEMVLQSDTFNPLK